MLIQRASDKAAAVRGKAVGNLASIIELWCGQKAGPLAASLGQFRQVRQSCMELQALVQSVLECGALVTAVLFLPSGDSVALKLQTAAGQEV